jgi:hypothetical protein
MKTTTKPKTPAAPMFANAGPKFEHLLKQDKITLKDIEHLNSQECQQFSATFTAMIGQLKGSERDNFLDKIDAIITPVTKADI